MTKRPDPLVGKRLRPILVVLSFALVTAALLFDTAAGAGVPKGGKGKVIATGSFSCSGYGAVSFHPSLKFSDTGEDRWHVVLRHLSCTALESNVTTSTFAGYLTGDLYAMSDSCLALQVDTPVSVSGTLEYMWTGARVGTAHVAPSVLSPTSITLQPLVGPNSPVILSWSGSTVGGSFAGTNASGNLKTYGNNGTETDLLTACSTSSGVHSVGVDATSTQG